METTSSFGYWIHRQRKALDLTQQALAERVGCSLAAIKKIESDERRPSRQIAERLADVLGVSANQREIFLEVARGLRSVEQLSLAREPASHARPTGTVTFLYTDIEGSTKLAHQYRDAWEALRKRHHAILREAIEAHNGYVFQVIGDAFCAAFHTVGEAVRAAVKCQVDLQAENWGEAPIRVRMGIHIGKAEVQQEGLYHGYLTLSHVQRLMSAGHGGQVLLSFAAQELVQDELSQEVKLRDMGERRLKDFERAEHIFQLNIKGLPGEFPPLNTLDSAHHNLPVQLTSFIGREKEIAEVIRLLEKARLVTLTGAGGTGKTRLAIQVANELLDPYPDGVWMVELAPILDPLLIPRTVAISMGLRDEPHRPVIEMLCDSLREKKLLLILDNCEHLIEACAQMADTLLHVCPHIRILASSREALGVAGETLYLVPSLALPDIQNLPPVESLSQYEAIQLFIDRATSAVPRFIVTDENASSIAQICQRLDGIPLAIELAAGKIRALSTGQIAQRLNDRFHLLNSGSRTALPRHQTLQAAIEWSYNLLPANEQTLFRRLSVFVNGWTLEAAESVCSDKDTLADDALKKEDILELLTQLVNKSLVMTDESRGEVRYHMLETIRQFGSNKLEEANEGESLHDRHMEFFTQFAETADLFLRRTELFEWLQRLDDGHDNLRLALQWALGKRSAEPALRLTGALAVYWTMRCFWLEGAKWLESALKKPSVEFQEMSKTEKAARAKALYGDAVLIFNLDNLDRMQASAEASLNLYEELGNQRRSAMARIWLGYALARRGDNRSARLLEKSLTEFRELKDPAGQYFSLYVQLRDYYQTEGAKKAKEVALEVLRLARLSEHPLNIAYALKALAEFYFLCGQLDQAIITKNEANEIFKRLGFRGNFILPGLVAYLRHDYDQAKECFTQTINVCEPLGEKFNRSIALFWLGVTYQDEGNLEQAREFLEKALAIQEEVGGKDFYGVPANSLPILGQVFAQQGDFEKAALMVKESLLRLKEFDFDGEKAITLILVAWLFTERSPLVATRLLATAYTKHETMDSPLEPIVKTKYQQYLAVARSRLDEQAFNAAWAEGEKMEINQAIDYALSEIDEIEKTIQAK